MYVQMAIPPKILVGGVYLPHLFKCSVQPLLWKGKLYLQLPTGLPAAKIILRTLCNNVIPRICADTGRNDNKRTCRYRIYVVVVTPMTLFIEDHDHIDPITTGALI